ncbi:Alpha-2-macroglobulin receptor-associated protein [Lamellibrachia satsuma]|nr:Alpha-2-macroglobulin receptor-associated protein [Lamellibrachia satsuma]
MNKINLFWEKASKKLKPGVLADLFAELKIQDKLELDAKRKKAEGFDESGEHEAMVRNRLHDILRRFGVEHNKIPDGQLHNSDENDVWLKDPADIHREGLKVDKKLGKLWKKAQKTGFTDEELLTLKTEFIHHQQKLDEFDELRNEINALEDISENSLERFKDGEDTVKSLKNKHVDLKRQYHSLQNDYKKLEQKFSSNDETTEFQHPKVVELWQMAKQSNFSERELTSFKEELKHFEHKLNKHEVFKNEADLATGNLKKDNSGMSSDQHKLQVKAKEYGRKVKKLHTELKMRISDVLSAHNEL